MLKITSNDLIIVEHLENDLIVSYGPYAAYPRAQAILGEKKGKWRIVDENEKFHKYENQMMMPCSLAQVYETKGIKKKIVAWIQDDFIRGGAEISSELVMSIGRDLGYRIIQVTPKTQTKVIEQILSISDFAVIGNFWNFNLDQVDVVLKAFYTDKLPYVKYEHDHRELTRPEFSYKLFRNSVLNIFLSPIHLENHKKSIGADGICLPLAIDVDFFHCCDGKLRIPKTALVCNIRNFKRWIALQKYIDEHPEIEFHVITNGTPVVSGANVHRIEPVPYEKMPELYCKYEYLVHLLDGWGAGERVIFEAALCGCKIVANEWVGHMSWQYDLTDIDGLRDWLRLAPYKFWQEIYERVG